MGGHSAVDASQVSQEKLESHDGVPAGKYTAGLGQVRSSTALQGTAGSRCCMHPMTAADWLLGAA